MSDLHLCRVMTPLGPYLLQETDGFLTAVLPAPEAAPPPPEPCTGKACCPRPVLQQASRQLTEYFAGQRTAFDLPLRPQGTAFQQAVWAELAKIPYGSTVTYGQLAAALGKPTASRAVGSACHHNPLHIVLPCHRVVGANGSLTGYAGGMERKKFLLLLEQTHSQ